LTYDNDYRKKYQTGYYWEDNNGNKYVFKKYTTRKEDSLSEPLQPAYKAQTGEILNINSKTYKYGMKVENNDFVLYWEDTSNGDKYEFKYDGQNARDTLGNLIERGISAPPISPPPRYGPSRFELPVDNVHNSRPSNIVPIQPLSPHMPRFNAPSPPKVITPIPLSPPKFIAPIPLSPPKVIAPIQSLSVAKTQHVTKPPEGYKISEYDELRNPFIYDKTYDFYSTLSNMIRDKNYDPNRLIWFNDKMTPSWYVTFQQSDDINVLNYILNNSNIRINKNDPIYSNIKEVIASKKDQALSNRVLPIFSITAPIQLPNIKIPKSSKSKQENLQKEIDEYNSIHDMQWHNSNYQVPEYEIWLRQVGNIPPEFGELLKNAKTNPRVRYAYLRYLEKYPN
jgi:hypothetical protein